MKQQGFPKSAHLLRTADFRKVYSQGRRRNLSWLRVLSLPTGREGSRVGLTVPASLGGAVVRNRIKRRLREAVRRHWREIGPGWDIVLHPRSEALTQDFDSIQRAVAEIFRACSHAARPAPERKGRAG